MEDYYEYLDSNGVTTLYKLIKDDTVALIDSYSVTINGITTNLDNHINNTDIHTPITDIENMVDTKISGLVNSAPETLDTLKELSDALGNDPNFATTIANQIGSKANSMHSHVVSDITDFPTIPTKTSQLINDSGYITGVAWGDITSKPNFSTVATSGSYTDLSNTPTIPTKLSQLENDMGFGTGGDTSDCVHKTGDETIDGNKFFIQDVNVKNSDVDIAVTPSNNLFSCFRFRGKGNVTTASIQYSQRTYGVNDMCFYVFDASSNSHGFRIRTNNRLEPIENNTYSLGSSSSKWADVYSTNAHVTYTYTNRVITYSITHSTDDSYFFVSGGTDYNKGATLYLGGVSATNFTPGRFALSARKTDGSSIELAGSPDGTLKWNGKNVAIDDDVVHKSGDETIAGNKTFSNRVAFPSGYYMTTEASDNSLRLIRSGSNHGNNYKIIIQGDNGKIFAPNGFIGNLQGNADTATSATSATKSSYLDNYSVPGMNKIYLDWDNQVKSYVGLKVDNTTMGGLITTNNIGSQTAKSATYSTTPATSDNSTRIATTAWVRTYVDSVAGSNTVGSSVSAYWSNSSNVTATGQASSGVYYPACYSEYITKTPVVGTIYSGAQLYTVLNAYAYAKASTTGSSGSIYVTNNTAQATFSNPISATGKYLCTTANTVKFRAYTAQGSSSAVGSSSVVNNSSAKSIFIRVQ